jgi:hypothetical protein
VRAVQGVALLMGAAGLALIAWRNDSGTTPAGLAMVLLAALAWACGNTVSQRVGKVPILGFVVWSSVFAVPPLLALSLLIDGPAAIAAGLERAGWGTWAAVLWQSAGNTLFGYGAWAWLLARYPAATVSPMALLVPVFGMGASALLLGEALPGWKLLAAGLVIGGLALAAGSARPQRPHPQRLLHAAGLGLGIVAPAPEVVGAHRADDGAAGVLRHHQAAQRRARQRLGGVQPHRRAVGHDCGSTAIERPGVSGTPCAPARPTVGSGSGSSRKNTTRGLAPQHLRSRASGWRAPRP